MSLHSQLCTNPAHHILWPRPPMAVAEEAGPRFKLWHRRAAVSELDACDREGLTTDLCTPGGNMKRSHNYSSSDSELDDNVDVEKDSGDENRCERHITQLIYPFMNSLLLKVV